MQEKIIRETIILPNSTFKVLITSEEINKFERATILRRYMTKNMLTGNDMAKLLNMHRQTIYSWLLWENITIDEYNGLIEKGLTDEKIYEFIKYKSDNKNLLENYFYLQMERLSNTLNKLKRNGELKEKTLDLLIKLRNEINYLIYKNENKK